MEQISFKLDFFEGPLDLLLHLIAKNKLNINDVSIITLIEQYLEYIDSVAEDMEPMGEFLEMAARLIYIKTVSLLPRYEEAAELKKELEGRLIEYSLCKEAALNLKARYTGNLFALRNPLKIEHDATYILTHSTDELLAAYAQMNVKSAAEPIRAETFSEIVSKKIVSVASKIIHLLKRLYRDGSCKISVLFDGIKNKSERVAVFLAILELTKSGRIILSDDGAEVTFRRRQERYYNP